MCTCEDALVAIKGWNDLYGKPEFYPSTLVFIGRWFKGPSESARVRAVIIQAVVCSFLLNVYCIISLVDTKWKFLNFWINFKLCTVFKLNSLVHHVLAVYLHLTYLPEIKFKVVCPWIFCIIPVVSNDHDQLKQVAWHLYVYDASFCGP